MNVREFGARGDGKVIETKSLQRTIDACANAGGGKVVFPAGRYLTGTLFLRSGVTLLLEKDALLSASINLSDYPRMIPAVRSYTDNYTERSLIYAENLDRIGIEGEGALDGNGRLLSGPAKWRPYLLRFINCRGVTVKGITLRNSAMWAQHYLACDDVRIEGITVRNRCNINNDGLDIDGCHRVIISHCDISSEDDAIVLKSTLDRQCRNVDISDCRLSSDNNALKLGTESTGGFANIRMTRCDIYDTRNSGVALETVDGGTLENVEVSDLTMRNVASPIFVRLGNRARPYQAGLPKPPIGVLRRVHISNIVATGANRIGCSLHGLPGHPVEDIALENIRITCEGGGCEVLAKVPELPAKYPEHSMFGALPAYGFYCRHVVGLQFRNVEIDFAKKDARPGLVCEDVAHLDIAAWKGLTLLTMRLTQVEKATLDGAPVEQTVSAKASLAGTSTAKTGSFPAFASLDFAQRLLAMLGLRKME
jgi:polygalacturonase